MTLVENKLRARANNKCELCNAEEALQVYSVPPHEEFDEDSSILICKTCKEQIEDPEKRDSNHWRCLNESMWNEYLPVQIVSWRMLNQLRSEGWPQDLLDMMYLDEDAMKWAKATETSGDSEAVIHKDSNGNLLENGDTVVLIKDLDVKGANFTAKRGTAVHRISLVHDNAEHIEGRVEGQYIVILTKFVKKK
ncbi:PhnA domain-containing protein [Robertkochia solimangrovi]|uniref:PhnA domain-containing protein n=1 Tax=Robertkochia solimangrovi TaxID=2213046 RepID=UPI00117DB4FF|nr:alkylphosphonate utilization protein [Robertkochia solimangrovi]TRZ40990.1 PhnA protein [Robertkochia solimangrovi]